MKADRQQISTARGVALVRAMEMTRPGGERVSSDPYAQHFANPLMVLATRFSVASGISRLIGVEPMINFAVAREQYVHDLIVREVRAGLDQIVVLGAGFDTRAYRIPGIAGIPVFEVDHPVTQSAKREALRGVVEPLPANVRFVAVDFDVDDLGDRLRAEGYAATGRTLFVWQGVTMYLTADGVDRTLDFVAMHSGPGSVVVFDYFDIAEGGNAGIRFFTRAMGEAVTFGIRGPEIESFLTSRGFADVHNIDGPELKRLHLTGPNARRPMAGGVGIVSARVA
jgi:methyltransferase (TIGR00027 family)